jgi:hypothetical protein
MEQVNRRHPVPRGALHAEPAAARRARGCSIPPPRRSRGSSGSAGPCRPRACPRAWWRRRIDPSQPHQPGKQKARAHLIGAVIVGLEGIRFPRPLPTACSRPAPAIPRLRYRP